MQLMLRLKQLMLLVSAWDDSGTFGVASVAQAKTEAKLQKQVKRS